MCKCVKYLSEQDKTVAINLVPCVNNKLKSFCLYLCGLYLNLLLSLAQTGTEWSRCKQGYRKMPGELCPSPFRLYWAPFFL